MRSFLQFVLLSKCNSSKKMNWESDYSCYNAVGKTKGFEYKGCRFRFLSDRFLKNLFQPDFYFCFPFSRLVFNLGLGLGVGFRCRFFLREGLRLRPWLDCRILCWALAHACNRSVIKYSRRRDRSWDSKSRETERESARVLSEMHWSVELKIVIRL